MYVTLTASLSSLVRNRIPAKAELWIISPSVKDVDGKTLHAGGVRIVEFDSNGDIDIQLLATNTPNTDPSDWQYAFQVRYQRGYLPKFFAELVQDSDLSELQAMDPVNPQYAPVNVIIDGHVEGDNLILERRDGTEINAGSVRGPAGEDGEPGGAGSIDSVNGDPGPDVVLNAADIGAAEAVHTHTASQVTDFNSAADSRVVAGITGKADASALTSHTSNTSNPHSVTKAQVGLTNVDNTSDANKPVSTATQTALNAKANTSSLAAVATSGAYADLTGTVPTAALPPLAINETYPVASQAAMLALSAQRGDMAIRSDNGKTYVLSTDSPGTLADWKEVLAAGQVQSVNTQTGVVTLTKSDVGLSNVDNTADTAKPVSSAQQTALDAKVPTSRTVNAKALSSNITLNQDDVGGGTTNKQYSATEQTKLAGVASGATANDTDANLKARANHTGTQSADTITDGTTNKAYTATEKNKLAGVATGATANSTDAQLRDRSTHTGTQAAGTITGLATVATSGAKADVGLGKVQNIGVWVLNAAEARPAGVQSGDLIFRRP